MNELSFYLKNARERGICKYALFELGKFKKFLRYICQMLQSVSKIRNDLYPRFFEIDETSRFLGIRWRTRRRTRNLQRRDSDVSRMM